MAKRGSRLKTASGGQEIHKAVRTLIEWLEDTGEPQEKKSEISAQLSQLLQAFPTQKTPPFKQRTPGSTGPLALSKISLLSQAGDDDISPNILTAAYLNGHVLPFLEAVDEMQNFLDRLANKAVQPVFLEELRQHPLITLHLKGGEEALRVISAFVIPWRKSNQDLLLTLHGEEAASGLEKLQETERNQLALSILEDAGPGLSMVDLIKLSLGLKQPLDVLMFGVLEIFSIEIFEDI